MTPTDLESFWNETRTELDQAPLNASLQEAPEFGGREFTTYSVALDSGCGLPWRKNHFFTTSPYPSA